MEHSSCTILWTIIKTFISKRTFKMSIAYPQPIGWQENQKKFKKHEINKELVTGRVNLINNKNQITISIGLTVCEVLEFGKNIPIDVLIHNHHKNILLVRPTSDHQNSYLLSYNNQRNNRFQIFKFLYLAENNFRLKHTISLPYEIKNDRTLIINMEKLRWSV